ncbi:hypothetical protein PR202_gb01504 [Eleusine coracana subsp. coracana]|uniref:NET2A-D/KIP1-like alpha-helical domain-containing protein n=1 Tax=Eleusine coracana subsp. coracana TaxID=191504 RepID=A0AAV5DWQ0_ELECO|nr:hypothetical protein PR202_gb01504 [Eleusine coracana subsp. coracana]
MAAQAIVSCEDTLTDLQNQQKRSSEEAKVEFQRANEAMDKLKTFKDECGLPHVQINECVITMTQNRAMCCRLMDTDESAPIECQLNLQELCQKVKELIEFHPEGFCSRISG